MTVLPWSEPLSVEVEPPPPDGVVVLPWSEPVSVEAVDPPPPGPFVPPWSAPKSVNTVRHYEWKLATEEGWVDAVFMQL